MKMKKLFLLAMFALFAVALNAQTIFHVATTSTKLGYFAANDLVLVESTGILYKLKVPTSAYTDMAYILGSTARYSEVGRLASTDTTVNAFYVDTISAQNIYGYKHWYSPNTFYSNAAITGTLGVTGATTLTTATIHEPAGTTNIAQFYNNKTTAGDSGVVINKLGYVGIGKSTATQRLDVAGNGTFTGSLTCAGTDFTTLNVASTSILAGKLTTHIAAGTGDLAAFYNNKTTAGDSGVVINKLGYVGIGKATATVPLDVVGAVSISGATQIGGVLTADVLPTFTLAAGQLIPTIVGDTIGVNIAGLTTSAIVLVSYGESVGAADTLAAVHTLRTGRLTVIGENGKKINYWVAKK